MFLTEKGPRFLDLLRDYQHNLTSLSLRLAHQNHSDIVDIGQRRTGLQEIAGPKNAVACSYWWIAASTCRAYEVVAFTRLVRNAVT